MNTRNGSINLFTLRRSGGCILLIYGFLNLHSYCSAASIQESLNVGLDRFTMDQYNTGMEFELLCKMARVPCGLELIQANDLQAPEGNMAIQLEKTTPRKVLDAIAERYPAYRWVIRDGVVNFEPKKKLNSNDALSRKVEHVSIHDASSYKAALDIFLLADVSVSYGMMGPMLSAKQENKLLIYRLAEAACPRRVLKRRSRAGLSSRLWCESVS